MQAKQIYQLAWLLFLALAWVSAAGAQQTPDQQVPGPQTAKTEPAKPAPSTKEASANDSFLIGEADVLQISIWQEPGLSSAATVRPDGSISLALVNEVKVAGLTTTQVQSLLEEKYKKFLTEPRVTVTVSTINSRKAYLTGEIPRPGSYLLLTPTTVLQLIAQGGGFTQFAKRNKIFVLRNVGGRQTRLEFNYSKVVQGDAAHQNIILTPGDTVVVP